MKYMLDTNMCIYLIKNKPESVLLNLREKIHEGVIISAITLAELEYGVEASAFPEKNAIALNQFLSILDILPFDDRAAVEYGKIYAVLKKKGNLTGKMDALIAAHARSAGLVVVTNNTREFERIEGLRIENWVKI